MSKLASYDYGMINTVIAMAISPSVESTIDAATKRHGRVFVAYIVALVVTALVVTLLTWLVWASGNKVQDAIQADANARILEAKNKATSLEGDLSTEKGKVAGLQKDAADAKAAQQKVEIDLAKQQERAANAERDAAEAKLELADFRTPRSIQDRAAFVTEMKVFSGQKFSCGVANDQEAFAFLFELQMELRSSGWVPIPPQSGPPFIDVGMGDATGAGGAGIGNGIGVYVEYPHHPSNESIPRARALVSALNKHGIIAREATSAIAPDTLNIFVGEKPGRWKSPNISAKHP